MRRVTLERPRREMARPVSARPRPDLSAGRAHRDDGAEGMSGATTISPLEGGGWRGARGSWQRAFFVRRLHGEPKSGTAAGRAADPLFSSPQGGGTPAASKSAPTTQMPLRHASPVTGGGSGVGRAVALALAEAGVAVTICGAGGSATRRLQRQRTRPRIVADVTDEASDGGTLRDRRKRRAGRSTSSSPMPAWPSSAPAHKVVAGRLAEDACRQPHRRVPDGEAGARQPWRNASRAGSSSSPRPPG